MAKSRLTLSQLALKIQNEADAYKYLEGLRWPNKPICPHCGTVDDHYFLTPENGETRATRTGSASQRRVWKCRSCRKQFSVLTGTIFHGTKVPVRTWVFVIFEMASSKNGIAAREIERKYGVQPKTAWYMMHRIREAMKREPMAGLLKGRVVSDETFIGGTPRNRHGYHPKNRMQGQTDKTPVVALVSRETGEVRSYVTERITRENLRQVITREVDPAETHLHTDSAVAYQAAHKWLYKHSAVDHSVGEYVRGDVSTNQAESLFSQLKRSIDGTHHPEDALRALLAVDPDDKPAENSEAEQAQTPDDRNEGP